MWYVPRPVYQLDGSQCQGSACWAATGCVLLDGATNGGATLTPTAFRQRAGGGSGSSSMKECPSGFESDVEKGLVRMGVKASTIRLTATQAHKRLSTERAAMFAIATDYELWPEKQKGAAPRFDGNHMVAVIPGLNAKGRVTVINPLVDHVQLVDLDAVLDAAVKFSKDHGRGGAVWLVRVYRHAVPVPGQTPADRDNDALRVENEQLRDLLDDIHDQAADIVADTLRYDEP